MKSSVYGHRHNPKPAPCHPDKEFYAKGMCRSCYYADKMRAKASPRNPAPCHPWREMYAREMCSRCYYSDKMNNNKKAPRKPATCHPNRELYVRGMCSSCYKKERSKTRSRAGEGKYRFWKYKLTNADIEKMTIAQSGKCAICKTNPVKVVDHDHASGKVRGLLCPQCNTGIGQFKDDPARLLSAIHYLSMHQESLEQVI